MIRRKFVLILAVVILSVYLLSPSQAYSADDYSDVQGGLHVGFSPYSGIIGGELQTGHYGLILGVPASLGVRYFFREQRDRWFIGAHVMYYESEEEETKKGIRYDELKVLLTGFGFGHKWRFKEHWDFILSLSLAYQKEEYSNSYAELTEEALGVLPGITIGYTF